VPHELVQRLAPTSHKVREPVLCMTLTDSGFRNNPVKTAKAEQAIPPALPGESLSALDCKNNPYLQTVLETAEVATCHEGGRSAASLNQIEIARLGSNS
jgi:hypothetical protein